MYCSRVQRFCCKERQKMIKVTLVPTGPFMVNTYIAWDDETKKGFVVDPGGCDQKLISEIEKRGIEMDYIILTHGHADHIGGVEELKSKYEGCQVVCAEAEKGLLADPRQNSSTMFLGKEIAIEPDITVNEGDTMEIGNIKLKFMMTPGHTKGGMCIVVDGDHSDKKLVFSGDTLFQMSIGRTDLPGGSFMELIDSIVDKLMKLPDDTYVLPGHMGVTTIGYERDNNPFLR